MKSTYALAQFPKYLILGYPEIYLRNKKQKNIKIRGHLLKTVRFSKKISLKMIEILLSLFYYLFIYLFIYDETTQWLLRKINFKEERKRKS